MRIGSSADKKDSGKIHVDFAQARDDLYEWECKQRHLAREERHHRRIQEAELRAPSPPPIVHYSEHEASLLAEKLKGKFFSDQNLDQGYIQVLTQTQVQIQVWI